MLGQLVKFDAPFVTDSLCTHTCEQVTVTDKVCFRGYLGSFTVAANLLEGLAAGLVGHPGLRAEVDEPGAVLYGPQQVRLVLCHPGSGSLQVQVCIDLPVMALQLDTSTQVVTGYTGKGSHLCHLHSTALA